MADTPTTMRALTIRQPWADAIVHARHEPKRVENRTWRIPAALVRTRILIHSAAAPDRRGVLPMAYLAQNGNGTAPDVRGAVIAVATLAGQHRAWASGAGPRPCCAPWGQDGCWHWELAGVRPLPEPVPAKGRLGLWRPDEALLAAVQQQLGEVNR